MVSTIVTGKLPTGTDRVRLAVISDMHISRSIGPWMVGKVVDIVNESKADIFLSLGDLIDRPIASGSEEAALLRSIQTRYGSFGVTGNHEFYGSAQNALDFHAEASIRLLRGEVLDVGGIRLAGIEDAQARRRGIRVIPGWKILKHSADHEPYTLFLKHRPKIYPHLAGRFNLQLSGHTHGGQIWPAQYLFAALEKEPPARHLNMVQAPGGKICPVFVTNGAGYWGPPLRLFTPPEVVILDIVREGTPIHS